MRILIVLASAFLVLSSQSLRAEPKSGVHGGSRGTVFTRAPLPKDPAVVTVDILKAPKVEEGKALDFELADGRKAHYRFYNDPELEVADSAVTILQIDNDQEVDGITLRGTRLTVSAAHYDKTTGAIYEFARDKAAGKNALFVYDTKYKANAAKATKLLFHFDGEVKSLTRTGNDFTLVTVKDEGGKKVEEKLQLRIGKNEKGDAELQKKK